MRGPLDDLDDSLEGRTGGGRLCPGQDDEGLTGGRRARVDHHRPALSELGGERGVAEHAGELHRRRDDDDLLVARLLDGGQVVRDERMARADVLVALHRF